MLCQQHHPTGEHSIIQRDLLFPTDEEGSAKGSFPHHLQMWASLPKAWLYCFFKHWLHTNLKPHSGYLTLVGVPWHPTTASAWEHQHKVIQDTATWGLPPCSSESPNSWVKRTAPVGLRQRKEECRDKAGLFKTCFQVNQGFCLGAVHSAGWCHIPQSQRLLELFQLLTPHLKREMVGGLCNCHVSISY